MYVQGDLMEILSGLIEVLGQLMDGSNSCPGLFYECPG